MTALDGFDFHRLVRVPVSDKYGRDSRDSSGGPRADEPDPLLAAVAGAHAELTHNPGPTAPALCSAWIRPPGKVTMQFLLGGRPGFPPATKDTDDDLPKETPRPILFPPGAAAVAVPELEALAQLKEFEHWVPCQLLPDALWAPDPGKQGESAVRRGAFERYAAHLGTPFAWLVIAEPLQPADVRPQLDRLVTEILPLTRSEVGEAKRIELERKQGRHRELSRAQLGGSWRIRVLVGGDDEGRTVSTAATLCSAADLDRLPYVLSAGPKATTLTAALQETEHTALVAGSDLVVTLTRPPQRELPGLRVVEPHTFDMTQEQPAELHGPSLALGNILDEAGQVAEVATLSRETLNRHTFVCGATGAGKSQTVRHLLTEASRQGLSWLVVEPAKAEYAQMATRLAAHGGDVIVIRPGDPGVAPAGFNPLEPAEGFSLQTHIDLLRALFLAAFESHEPFPQILSTALVRSYEELGWDLTLGEPLVKDGKPRYPTLADLQRVAAQVVTDIGYGKEASADVSGFIKVRLSSLRLGTTGRFFEGGHAIQFDRLRDHNVVLEIEDVGDDADKAFLMGAVLIRLSEHLRQQDKVAKSKGLEHLTVIEEAHRLLRRAEPGGTGPAVKAVEMFASLLAEVRAYGEGLVIAEQIPGKLAVDVIKNTAAKIVHRLPAEDDRESVGATMNLNEAQSRYVVTLTPGQAAFFTDGMDHPLLIKVPDGTDLERQVKPRTASVEALIERRSKSCGPECRASACTLRDMRTAQQLLAEHPWLTIWSELTVLAHLAGYNTPTVDVSMLPPAGRIRMRDFDCALSHAVDAAIASRSALLQPTTDPDELAVHSCASIGATLRGGDPDPDCDAHGLRYLARRYALHEVRLALKQPTAEQGRHPDSDDWELRLHRRFPGTTVAEQLALVDRWWDDLIADQAACDQVTFGTSAPSLLEQAIGGSVLDPAWSAQVDQALRPFRNRWPKQHLLRRKAAEHG
ncbi:ATP-binding protein [Kribbella sp. NPDC026611]|uniref:ATP-binding protein n=1 Tax=Kribbella sp. NPDC026611 TaxID=3154911 RepID=UPI0033D4EF28